jgi:glycosyltransferase involved in cell wall biosynthesis
MKVFFHTRGSINESPYYHYTFNYPPAGINYEHLDDKSDVLLSPQSLVIFKTMARLVNTWLTIQQKTYMNKSVVPKKAIECELIHAFNTIPVNATKPYITEMEAFTSLFIGSPLTFTLHDQLLKELKSAKCKKILFWTKNAHDNFLNVIHNDKKIKKKCEILYPAVPLYNKNKVHKIPTIGFIARSFKNKGGEYILEPMKNFVKAGLAKAIVVTDLSMIDKDTIKKYSKYITFFNLMPRIDLHKKIYPKLDVLFYPGLSDTYGFAIPEAMSHGIPVLTFDGVARKELVHDGLGGYVVGTGINMYPHGYIESVPSVGDDGITLSIMMKLTNIIKDKKLREKMSNYCYDLVKSGQFSLFNRNARLKQIYEEALK